ncbi:MAG: hypothetical protein ACFFCS_21585 [Candidatus Hodarchaeota archaeon]
MAMEKLIKLLKIQDVLKELPDDSRPIIRRILEFKQACDANSYEVDDDYMLEMSMNDVNEFLIDLAKMILKNA